MNKKMETLTWLLFAGFILCLLDSCNSHAAEYHEPTPFQKVVYSLPDEKTIIGCFNSHTYEIREPDFTHSSVPGGFIHCSLGGSGWHNIMLPPRSHFPAFREFWSEAATVNRLAVINFESGFVEWRDSGNGAIGYAQTRKSKGIPGDIRSQLKWMSDSDNGWRGDICSQFWDTDFNVGVYVPAGDRAVATCLARGHFGFHKPGSPHYNHSTFYAKRYRLVTDFYIKYFFIK